MPVDESTFIDDFLKELRSNTAAVFVGAGLSRAAGYVDWPSLLASVAKGIGLDSSRESDLVSLAQYVVNHRNSRQSLTQLLVDEFSDVSDPTENHRLLARLPIQTYWTTNYDKLIEAALADGRRQVDTKYTVAQLSQTKRGRDAVLYKMHGDVEHASEAILTKDQYERYPFTHAPFITALSGDLVSKTFLFLGFSFTDPNLDYILSRIRIRFDGNSPTHYCIMRRRTKDEEESDAAFKYAERKQDHMVRDLQRFNIQTVFVDDFDQITAILHKLEARVRQKTVLISGSAIEFGDWGEAKTSDFLYRLARELINRGLRINTGFGIGVGGPVVAGAVQQIYSTKNRTIEDQLFLRPFPIGITNAADRESVFKRYRDELVRQAGTALFVLGNKKEGDQTVLSGGVRDEFKLAHEAGLHCVAVGASGYMAEQLASEVLASFDDFFEDNDNRRRQLYERLNTKTADPLELLKPTLELIDLLSKD